MRSDRAIKGRVVQAEDPCWSSLEFVLGSDLSGWFMWMYELRLGDGTRIDVYKHVTTRRYLHLASGGRAFEYRVSGFYREADLAIALAAVFRGWERVQPPVQHRHLLASALVAARDMAA